MTPNPLMAGYNAVVSGVFLDAATAFVATDSTTQGGWIGTHGGDGYQVVGDSSSTPSYATVGVTGESTAVWDPGATDARALQKSGGTDRIAACWYSATQFTIDVDLTDGLAHEVGLYALDWDTTDRAERIDVVDAATGAVIDSRTVSSFNGGKYLEWEVRGDVQLRVTCLAGANAVVSGVFLDAGTGALPAAAATWTLYDGPAPVLDFNASGTQTARYLDGPTPAGVDAVLAREVSGSTAWYLGDRLGTIRDLVNNSGATVDHVDYTVYGGVEAESAPSVGDRFKYAGMRYDAATGLYDDQARWYDPSSGRFISQDPSKFTSRDANLYRYVKNGSTPSTSTHPGWGSNCPISRFMVAGRSASLPQSLRT
jgi:RHS repeat-associated protein